MLRSLCALTLLVTLARGQSVPTLEEVRKGMAIPSMGDLRGQQDGVGFATTAAQMAEVVKASARGPRPESFGPGVDPGVPGVICPHDDYLYAGRVYREVLPLVTARTVVLVGVFHKYRKFGVKDRLVFDPYRAWRTPDGPVPVSPLRDELLAALPEGDRLQDAAMHDLEQSLEPIAFWLRHQRPDLEILPVILPEMGFPRMVDLADRLGGALARAMKARQWQLGRDLAIVLSSDGIHYGEAFQHTPFGPGGVGAFQQAMARERAILQGPLSGPVEADKARAFFETCVDPERPGTYRVPWCGRFSVPFGMLLLARTAQAMGMPPLEGRPLALQATVDVPELPLRTLGLGVTAPANLYHFVGLPGVAFMASKEHGRGGHHD